MRKIPLTQDKLAIVDDEDFEYLNQWKWCYNGQYAVRGGYNTKGNLGVIMMHRLINKTPSGMITDHINRDKLDNRKSNLRNANEQTNAFNSGVRSDSSSGIIGVSYAKRDGLWRAHITVMGKHISLGYFKTKELAINARKQGEGKYICM